MSNTTNRQQIAVRFFQASGVNTNTAAPRKLVCNLTGADLYTVKVSSPMAGDAMIVLYQGRDRAAARKAWGKQANRFQSDGYRNVIS